MQVFNILSLRDFDHMRYLAILAALFAALLNLIAVLPLVYGESSWRILSLLGILLALLSLFLCIVNLVVKPRFQQEKNILDITSNSNSGFLMNNQSIALDKLSSSNNEEFNNSLMHIANSTDIIPNPLDNAAWLQLVEECVELYTELEKFLDKINQNDSPQVLLDHLSLKLKEILVRNGIEIIEGERNFNIKHHQPEQIGNVAATPDAAIQQTISPGFAVGNRILRRARVRLENK